MSNPIFWVNYNKYHQFIAAELAKRVEKVNNNNNVIIITMIYFPR